MPRPTHAGLGTTRLAVSALAGALLLAACSGGSATTTTAAGPQPTVAPPTTTTLPATTVTDISPTETTIQADPCPVVTSMFTGAVTEPRLTEISGIVASRSQPGVFWVHNDSGDEAIVYALAADGGLLASYELAGIVAIDWEDVAIGPGPNPGVDYLYLGDVGNNSESRAEVLVYRIAEPNVAGGASEPVQDVTTIPLQFPDEAYDVEVLLVDPASGDILLVTKTALGGSRVFRTGPDGGQLAHVATLRLGLGGFATGGDVTADGDRVVVRTYSALFVWPRPAGQDVAAALEGSPCVTALLNEAQGEAVTFTADGSALYTISEGAGSSLQRHDFGD